MTEARTNLLSLDRPSMEAFFSAMGEQSFRAQQILKWVYQRQVMSIDEMTDLSKDLRHRLKLTTSFDLPQIVSQQLSSDGTVKWVLKLHDGNCIETVFIPESDRGTLCISSQAGCALNCTFCATARQGFSRNLETSEIIGQLWVANHAINQMVEENGYNPVRREDSEEDAASSKRLISNVVMMGMGEPLLNFDNVIAAMRLMQDDFSFGLSRRRVTLSTAGMVPQIDRLRELCPVSLAVSLHAPDNELRQQLVPLNRKYPIEILLEACRRYTAGHQRERITFEYVMLEGINDSVTQARQLARILADVPAKVNLIPFNPSAGINYRCSSKRTIDQFRDVLLRHDIFTVTRKTRGTDIDAACGQLAGRVNDRTSRSIRLARRLHISDFDNHYQVKNSVWSCLF